MTPDRRRMVLWAGCGAAVVAAGFAVLLIRGSSHGETISGADTLHASYVKLYHPDKPDGFAIEPARNELRAIVASQSGELATTEGALAPPLASAYLVDSLSDAAAQVTSDYAALRQLSARTRIAIPASLPFEGGLDADAKVRSRQLASLALIRLAMQTSMHAGVTRIANVGPGLPFASAGGEYAVFTAEVDVEADWAATARLVAAFAQADGRGLGLRALEATGAPDKPLRVRITATLTTTNRDTWGLGALPASAPPAASPAAGSGGTGEGGGRLRRLGGSRP